MGTYIPRAKCPYYNSDPYPENRREGEKEREREKKRSSKMYPSAAVVGLVW